MLTREHGLVRAVAKGAADPVQVRGASGTVRARGSAPVPGRNLDTITQAHTLHAFCDVIAADYGRYTTGCAIVETAERLAGEERAPAARLHQLTVGALTALAEDRRPRELILDAFLLRAMSYAGWMPSLSECARCGRPGPHRAFHVAAGGAVCVLCRPPGAATPSPGVLELMDALYRGEWGQSTR